MEKGHGDDLAMTSTSNMLTANLRNIGKSRYRRSHYETMVDVFLSQICPGCRSKGPTLTGMIKEQYRGTDSKS